MNSQDPRLITHTTLRRSVGFIALFFPALLIIGTTVIGNCSNVQESISHYYHTIVRDWFVGVLCAVAFFLIIYKGYSWIDNVLTNLAGVFALGVAFFPTIPCRAEECCTNYETTNPIIENIHYISAALFFITLAIIAIFLFTKGNPKPTKEKKLRNTIYRIMGSIILLAILLIFIFHTVIPNLAEWAYHNKLIFILEYIALIAFGIVWLIKGEIILKDK